MTLTGCAASRLMLRYGDLETQTEMSESVFLELRSELPKTVFLAESSTLVGSSGAESGASRYAT